MAATLIATCGIYGLTAYAVAQRRREIGARMALGAERGDELRLVLTRALRTIVARLIVGLAGAAGVTRVLQTFLFGVTPTDPITFTIVTLLLMAVGLTAAWLPARRATRIDPCAALLDRLAHHATVIWWLASGDQHRIETLAPGSLSRRSKVDASPRRVFLLLFLKARNGNKRRTHRRHKTPVCWVNGRIAR
jgi:hypothetical protein